MKYKFTGKTKNVAGKTLHQIVCVTAFLTVAVGDIGGWIESNKNLSQRDNAWVSGDAQVSGNAQVSGDAHVFGNARVRGDAWVRGDVQVSGDAWVLGNAQVFGDARVYGDARVRGDAQVSGNSRVSGDAHVFGNAWVSGDAQILTGEFRSEKLILTQIKGSKHSVNSPDGVLIKIGCQEHAPAFWVENFQKIGKGNGYSESEIEEYKRYIDLFSVIISESKK